MARGSSNRQLELFDPRRWEPDQRREAARALADHLSARVGEQVRLLVHDNRSTMLSFRRRGGWLFYRVHHMFLDAPREVIDALATFAMSPGAKAARPRQAGAHIDDYVKRHRVRIATPRATRLEPRGRAHDLQAIFDRLNATFFEGRVEASIGWGSNRGPAGAHRRRRTIKMGVYLHEGRLIRIHPALDRPEVPGFYVAAVVFHEMLHQVVPAVVRSGRRSVHGREFRRSERAYPDHAAARRWEEENMQLLLEG